MAHVSCVGWLIHYAIFLGAWPLGGNLYAWDVIPTTIKFEATVPNTTLIFGGGGWPLRGNLHVPNTNHEKAFRVQDVPSICISSFQTAHTVYVVTFLTH